MWLDCKFCLYTMNLITSRVLTLFTPCCTGFRMGHFDNYTWLCDLVQLLAWSGAYELPKAAKERAITVYTQVPSKYKFKQATVSILGKCASIRDLHDAIKCTCIIMACIAQCIIIDQYIHTAIASYANQWRGTTSGKTIKLRLENVARLLSNDTKSFLVLDCPALHSNLTWLFTPTWVLSSICTLENNLGSAIAC